MFWKAERLKSCYTGIKNASSLPQVWHDPNRVTGGRNKTGRQLHSYPLPELKNIFMFFPQVPSLAIFPSSFYC